MQTKATRPPQNQTNPKIHNVPDKYSGRQKMEVLYTIRELRIIKEIRQKLMRALPGECDFESVPTSFILDLPQFKYANINQADIDYAIEYKRLVSIQLPHTALTPKGREGGGSKQHNTQNPI